jgi:ABC-type transport system involved in multi-copper enzyme maturation permease subunit
LAGARALFTRALMLRTRSMAVLALRLLVGGVIGVMLWNAEDLLDMHAAPGRFLWQRILFMEQIALTPAVLFAAAGAITEERAQNTLGLLFMTGMGPSGVILGKAGARLVEVWLLLALGAPLALTAVALGGVSVGEVMGGFVELAAWLSLVAACGVFMSAFCADAFAATAIGVVLVLILLIPFALVQSACDVVGLPAAIVIPVAITVYGMLRAAMLRLQSEPDLLAGPAWIGAAGETVVAVPAHAEQRWSLRPPIPNALELPPPPPPPPSPTAPVPVPLSAADDGPGLPTVPWDPLEVPLPRAVIRVLFPFATPRPPGGLGALAWKEGAWQREEAGRVAVTLAAVALIPITIVSVIAGVLTASAYALIVPPLVVLTLYLALGIAAAVAWLVSGEVRSGTLDDLRALPLSPRGLYLAKLYGVARAFSPWLVLHGCGTALLLVSAAGAGEFTDVATVVAGVVELIACFWAVCALFALAWPRMPVAVAMAVGGGVTLLVLGLVPEGWGLWVGAGTFAALVITVNVVLADLEPR